MSLRQGEERKEKKRKFKVRKARQSKAGQSKNKSGQGMTLPTDNAMSSTQNSLKLTQ